jgi:hypothetical protein
MTEFCRFEEMTEFHHPAPTDGPDRIAKHRTAAWHEQFGPALTAHFYKIDRIHPFDFRCSTFDVRCSFLVSYSIKLGTSAFSGWAENRNLNTDLVAAEGLPWELT